MTLTTDSFLNTVAEIQRLCSFKQSNRIHFVQFCKLIVDLGDTWTETYNNGDGMTIKAKTNDTGTWYLVTDNAIQTIYKFRK